MTDLLHDGLRPDWGDATGAELWAKVHDRKFYPDETDRPELRRAFGYEHMVVMRRARQWLKAAHPDWTDEDVEWAAGRAYEAWGQQNPSLRETQAVGRVYAAADAENRWRDGASERHGMTRPEWELLAEHFAGANDPVAQSILARAQAALGRGIGDA